MICSRLITRQNRGIQKYYLTTIAKQESVSSKRNGPILPDSIASSHSLSNCDIRRHFHRPKSRQPLLENRKISTSQQIPLNSGFSHDDEELLRNSGRVVWGAVILNGVNFLAKTFTWIYTGSHSMFAESVHSLADTANQLILAVGIRKSLQGPTADHPYGYHPMRYIAPLISGVGIFCVGCGLSIYHE